MGPVALHINPVPKQWNPSMRSIQQWLQTPSTRAFSQTRKQLAHYNSVLNAALETRLQGLCHVSRCDGTTLWCLADNAAIATQMRFQAPYLVPLLQKRLRLPQLQKLVCHVASHQPPLQATKQRHPQRPSHTAADCLKSVAQHCKHPTLRKALEKIASRSR